MILLNWILHHKLQYPEKTYGGFVFNLLLYIFAGIGISVCLFSLAVLAWFLRALAEDSDEYTVALRHLIAYGQLIAKGGKH